jgi:hypothetical protein
VGTKIVGWLEALAPLGWGQMAYGRSGPIYGGPDDTRGGPGPCGVYTHGSSPSSFSALERVAAPDSSSSRDRVRRSMTSLDGSEY